MKNPERVDLLPPIDDADELTVISSDPKTGREYDARVREMNSIYASNSVSFEKGEKIGIEKGEKIGAEKERAKAYQEKIEGAKNALRMGLSVEQAALITGLSIDEIKKIGE